MWNTYVCKRSRGEYFVRILHISDQAGVQCTLAKYQTLVGHESKVLIVGASDKYGIYEFYKKYCTKIDRLDFVKTCLSEAECADLIHVRSRSDIFLEVYRKFRTAKKLFSTIMVLMLEVLRETISMAWTWEEKWYPANIIPIAMKETSVAI